MIIFFKKTDSNMENFYGYTEQALIIGFLWGFCRNINNGNILVNHMTFVPE